MKQSNTTTRDAIFSTIQQQLKRGPLADEQRQTLQQRLSTAPRSLIPARAQLEHAQQVELFSKMAEAASATLQYLETMDAVPAAIADYVLRHNLPSEIVLGHESTLASLPWHQQERLQIARRAARDSDKTSVSVAFAGIAETGTLLLHSGPDSPTTLNFLPDTHIVILPAARIVGPYEDAWDLLRQHLREQCSDMPRTLNMITGPSRSADIEQTLLLGAHGPIKLHIMIIDSATD